MPPTPQKPQNFSRPTGGYFELVPTPNPEELSFRVKGYAADFQATQMPAVGTRYAACSMLRTRPKVQLDGCLDYVYLECQREGDWLWFYFGKNKTVAQRNTPFRTSASTRQYPWPGVLYSLDIYKSSEFPLTIYNGQSIESAPRYFAKYRYKPTPNVSSVVKIEEYLSEVAYPQETLTHIQPIPTDINGDFLGKQINFPRCLHPRVEFDTNVPGAQKVFGQGTIGTSSGWNPDKQVFPATNFLDWTPFVIEDDVNLVNGQYYRRKTTIYPPVSPRKVTQ